MERIISITLAMCLLLSVTVYGYEPPTTGAASDTLSSVGVFRGSPEGYELDRAPTRLEGLIMLIRLLGLEKEAHAQNYSLSYFTDVPEWGIPYTNYAYEQGLTNGIGNDQFGSFNTLSLKTYATFVLRALGYDDKAGDFIYSEADLFLDDLLYLDFDDGPFDRGDLADISYESMYLPTVHESKMLISTLIEIGSINLDDFSLFNRVPSRNISVDKMLVCSDGGNEFISLAIEKDTMTVDATYTLDNQWAWFKYADKEEWQQFRGSDLNTSLSLSGISADSFKMTIYLNDSKYGNYRSWIYDYPISRIDSNFGFLTNPVYERNAVYATMNQSVSSGYLEDDYQIYTKNHRITALADQITADISSESGKLKTIHHWVAKNIYYDFDNPGVTNPSNYIVRYNDALYVLDNRHAICEGYANLAISMLRSIGIPARKVSGNTNLNDSSYYTAEDLLNTVPNHSWYEAYVDGRWVICDATFDSHNRKKNNVLYSADASNTFFDVSMEAFSVSHQILEYR